MIRTIIDQPDLNEALKLGITNLYFLLDEDYDKHWEDELKGTEAEFNVDSNLSPHPDAVLYITVDPKYFDRIRIILWNNTKVHAKQSEEAFSFIERHEAKATYPTQCRI